MKRSEKKLPSKTSLGLFCHLIALMLDLDSVEGLIVTKNVKKIKFEEVWGKLEPKKRFQRQ